MRIGTIQNEPTANEAEAEHSIILYPNPTTGVIYFSVKHLPISHYKVEVYDVAGKLVFTAHYTNNDEVKRLNLELNNGIYLLQITDSDNGNSYKQKMVIQH